MKIHKSNQGLLLLILNFVNERTRIQFNLVSSTHAKFLNSDAAFKWRLERLHIENGIYFSSQIPHHSSYKQLFLKNYAKRNLWKNNADTTTEGGVNVDHHQQFQLTVSARFKPKGLDHNRNSMKKISLPLHQRLKLIRMNRNITSQKEAFQVLVQQGDWFKGETDKLNDDAYDNRDDLKENKIESSSQANSSSSASISGGVHIIDSENNAVILVDRTKGLRKFEFDHVLNDTASQESVYEITTMPLISEFINGYNATCLVYGQTGSGKTFSMFGPHMDEKGAFLNNLDVKYISGKVPDTLGIVPRSVREIFRALEYRREHLQLNIEADLSISYIEIYGNDVSDLLKGGAICGQSRVSAQRYVLDGSSEVNVSSLGETLELLEEGEKQKRKAATAINARSSRAHTLFIVTLRQRCVQTGVSSTSRLFLADLGGSEQIKRSQPVRSHDGDDTNDLIDEEEHSKQRVKEAVNINLGLLALKQCVEGLRKKKHVPYSDSKLTMMLAAGLGGDSKTAVIVCGAQEESHGPETISAMKFGQTCRGIFNTVATNANMLESLLQNINDKISTCENKIRDNERWEEVEDVRYDDDGNVVEIRKKTKVAGADSYRLELNSLLRQKAELTGENIDELLKEVQGFGDFLEYTGKVV